MALQTPDNLSFQLKVYDFVHDELLTEENTDKIIAVISSFLPIGIRQAVTYLLDRMAPEGLQAAWRAIMIKTGFVDRSERYLSPENPFRAHRSQLP